MAKTTQALRISLTLVALFGFNRHLFAQAEPKPRTTLFVMNADGTQLKQLIDKTDFDGQGSARWSADGKRIVFDAFMQICTKHDEGALTKFLIYRDLRERGYVVKDGFGFDSDFRVYERGDFGTKGANYLVFGFNEGKQEKISSLQKKIEQITTMGKDPIIAVIERRGEVIYYKISTIKFLENKTDSKLDDLKL